MRRWVIISILLVALALALIPVRLGRGGLLCAAAGRGNVLAVRMLLAIGAKPDSLDRFGSTALARAAARGKLEVAQVLLQHGADATKAMPSAARGGHRELVELLLNAGVPLDNGCPAGMPPLYYAAESGRTEVVEYLLSQGADVNAAPGSGETALFRAAATWSAKEPGVLPTVKVLLAHGADVNAMGPMGMTPLHVAAHMGRTDVAQLLIDSGADVNARRDDGMSPLDVASNWKTVKLLLAHGALPGDKLRRSPARD